MRDSHIPTALSRSQTGDTRARLHESLGGRGGGGGEDENERGERTPPPALDPFPTLASSPSVGAKPNAEATEREIHLGARGFSTLGSLEPSNAAAARGRLTDKEFLGRRD
ncbi:unnamed protein product [Lampetra fluviatilis]